MKIAKPLAPPVPRQRKRRNRRSVTQPSRVPTLALRYVGEEPGLTRLRRGRGFCILDVAGVRIRERSTLQRIRSLAIPPAWTDVWICADDRGHLQATGHDARGRKQYRYHAQWNRLRGERKFDRLTEVGEILPQLRRRVATALAETGLSRDRVLAAVVSLLDSTFARIGNREYRRANGSFGLTTLENRHARGGARSLRLVFRGKSGVAHELAVEDPRVAHVIHRCQSLPGQRLFQYLDDAGEVKSIDSQDVNDWLRDTSGRQVTAKDFRTWHATSLALEALRKLSPPSSETAARAAFVKVVDGVAQRLGNTRAVCRASYIHPGLLAEFADGKLAGNAAEGSAPGRTSGLLAREVRLLRWLRAGSSRQLSVPLAG
ncbi:MAG: DNA topoisomerase IB [Thermoanaerobaculia bacterium]